MKVTPALFPKPLPSLKLLLTGATVGPLVDSFHNQCLLEYNRNVIDVPTPSFLLAMSDSNIQESTSYILRSSTYIPPLLAIAYLILGGVLPRMISSIVEKSEMTETNESSKSASLRNKAILAVSTTALIIKLSELLETSAIMDNPNVNLLIMLSAALTQWAVLDGTLVSFITASIVSIGGPLSELPFVAYGFWTYLPEASDYFPLQNVDLDNISIAKQMLGEDYRNLALSSITGPCYFAVTMDAIALGRYFDEETE
ncbi:hypothetical protein CTEN210_16416 [Chaetoceros tenuissimus]|uniref:Uncharacterized protein n=1 Tax=Chaetoceros tenuissimus TaxID=426638 RepID=A0AAD3DAS4_9STRA|nr:hypothetical protein CTEN210_16416 [Chaetoceros tenuissimus]